MEARESLESVLPEGEGVEANVTPLAVAAGDLERRAELVLVLAMVAVVRVGVVGEADADADAAAAAADMATPARERPRWIGRALLIALAALTAFCCARVFIVQCLVGPKVSLL